jgi:hypothetical protein
MESKVKCDREEPCSRCTSRGKKCVYLPPVRRFSGLAAQSGISPATSTSSEASKSAEATPRTIRDSSQEENRDQRMALRVDSITAPVGSYSSPIHDKNVFEPLLASVFTSPQPESFTRLDTGYDTCSPVFLPFMSQQSTLPPQLLPHEYTRITSTFSESLRQLPKSNSGASWTLAPSESDHYRQYFNIFQDTLI